MLEDLLSNCLNWKSFKIRISETFCVQQWLPDQTSTSSNRHIISLSLSSIHSPFWVSYIPNSSLYPVLNNLNDSNPKASHGAYLFSSAPLSPKLPSGFPPHPPNYSQLYHRLDNTPSSISIAASLLLLRAWSPLCCAPNCPPSIFSSPLQCSCTIYAMYSPQL